jgi:hydroxymethylbilane synthase
MVARRCDTGLGAEWIEIVPTTTTATSFRTAARRSRRQGALDKELDRALMEGRTDMSVHSMKDVETFRRTSS